MSELTLTLLRLGLLALLWIFIFGVVGVLRTDIYGTQVSRRTQRKAMRRQEKAQEKTQEKSGGKAGAGAAGVAAGAGALAGGAGSPGTSPVAIDEQGAGQGRGRGRRKSPATPTTLLVTEGPLAGTSLPLRGAGILIGRNPECALVLDDDYASGRHCRIYQGSTGWMVEDLGSTNGTFIGRDRLTVPVPVEVGTSLRIGKTVLELRG